MFGVAYSYALANYFVQRERAKRDTLLRWCGKAVVRLALDARSQTRDKASTLSATIYRRETTLDTTRRTSFPPDKLELTAK